MLLIEVLSEGALKRSDPFISGDSNISPSQSPAPKEQVAKRTPFQARLYSIATTAGVTEDKVRDLWIKHSGQIDQNNANRWAIITKRVKDELGL